MEAVLIWTTTVCLCVCVHTRVNVYIFVCMFMCAHFMLVATPHTHFFRLAQKPGFSHSISLHIFLILYSRLSPTDSPLPLVVPKSLALLSCQTHSPFPYLTLPLEISFSPFIVSLFLWLTHTHTLKHWNNLDVIWERKCRILLSELIWASFT